MRKSLKQKENIPFHHQTRLSLKLAQKNKKKSQANAGRMSMLPLKKQRLSVALQTTMGQSRPSILKNNINILNNSTSNMSSLLSTCHKSLRKEAIINNLVNKLDEQQQIRTIIESKLKRNNYHANRQFQYTSQFRPFSSNKTFQESQKILIPQLNCVTLGNQSPKNVLMQKELQKCQQQIQYFKGVIQKMAEKMARLQKSSCKSDQDQFMQTYHKNELTNVCKCTRKNNKTQQKATQTAFIQKEQIFDEKQAFEFDFYDNLDRTLKILTNNKKFR